MPTKKERDPVYKPTNSGPDRPSRGRRKRRNSWHPEEPFDDKLDSGGDDPILTPDQRRIIGSIESNS